MKRWIAILTLTVFGLVPTCGVFAMHPSTVIQDESCMSVMEAATEFHQGAQDAIHTPVPTLACCEHKDATPNSTQTVVSFEAQQPALHSKSFTYPAETTISRTNAVDSTADHPPDDFERFSQAKRE